MSQENLKVVQAAIDAYFRGDREAWLAVVSEEVLFTQFEHQPDARPYRGHEEMERGVAEWIDTWDDFTIEARDMRGFGDNVLVSLHQSGRGKASGVEMEGDVWFVFTVHDGKITRWQMFPDEGDALDAAEGD